MSRTEAPLVIVAGRQVVSREGVEVLALGTRQRFDDGKTAEGLIREVKQAGAIPVLPWGVGKWLGRRGRLVEDLIDAPNLSPLFIGDNSQRPTFWPRPTHFERANKRGIKNLPGSDPLPFPEEVRRAGSYGMTLRGKIDLEKPAQDLKRRLLDSSTTLRQFGSGAPPVRFVRNQLRIQLRTLFR
jgi:hypothetical protein